jgi:peptidoglycan/LPS O-acetylase OafA/YrhL
MSAPIVADQGDVLAPTLTLRKAIPELDGVRGVAILLVLLCHAGGFFEWKPLSASFGYGSVGVDLFFVLSGFLITGILIEARDDRNRTRGFYIRRGLRIWPLSLPS